jgi:hypothetical protein
MNEVNVCTIVEGEAKTYITLFSTHYFTINDETY